MKERIVLASPTHTGPALWLGCRPHFNVTLLLLLSSQGGNFSAHLPFPPILQRKEKESELNPTPLFFNCVRRLLFSFPKKQKKSRPLSLSLLRIVIRAPCCTLPGKYTFRR